MAIEIVDLSITVKIVIVHRFLYVYQRVQTIYNWGAQPFWNLFDPENYNNWAPEQRLSHPAENSSCKLGHRERNRSVGAYNLANSGLWYVQ